MKEIHLSQGIVTKVDDDDFERLSSRKWHAILFRKEGKYRVQGSDGKLIHRVIMDTPANMVVDHINGDTLDNRKQNLRNCTNQQNIMNRNGNRRASGLPKGVTILKGKYVANIRVNKKRIYLGRYVELKDASNAYNDAATKYFGEFAKLNPQR